MLRCRRLACVIREWGGVFVAVAVGMIVGMGTTCLAFSFRWWLDAWQNYLAVSYCFGRNCGTHTYSGLLIQYPVLSEL